MRRWLMLLLLAGCMAQPPDLGQFIMWPSEAPEDCPPTDPAAPDGPNLERPKGWTANPGRMDSEAFAAEGVAPEDNLVALFDCTDGSGISSSALWFPDFGASRKWAESTVRCDGELAFRDGRLVGVIAIDTPTPQRLAAANETLQRVLTSSEAIDLCPQRGTDARDPRRT